MNSKILIAGNNSSGTYDFRRELISSLIMQEKNVVVLTPFDSKIDELKNLGCAVINTTNLDRRGINPIRDLKLFNQYRKNIAKEKPDLAITYTIKPNVYCGYARRLIGKSLPEEESINAASLLCVPGMGDKKYVIYDDNHFVVEATTAINNVFFSWAFGFGGKVKIKDPKDISEQ